MGQINSLFSSGYSEESPTDAADHFEVCEDNECDSSLNDRVCEKNPDHKNFIAVKDFKMSHLPKDSQDPLIFDFVNNLIGLTVKVSAKGSSKQRPKNLSCYDNRVGSGWVRSVQRKFSRTKTQRCPCQECVKLPWRKKKREWAEFQVCTARHVVFNDEECQHTTIEVDFDEDKDRFRPAHLKLLGKNMLHTDETTDFCAMNCVTHDLAVYMKLKERLGGYNSLRGRLRKKFPKDGAHIFQEGSPILCVSHPHGSSKHVSIGEYTGSTDSWELKWKYSTATCPGCSGAPVTGLKQWWLFPGHLTTHSCCKSGEDNMGGGWLA